MKWYLFFPSHIAYRSSFIKKYGYVSFIWLESAKQHQKEKKTKSFEIKWINIEFEKKSIEFHWNLILFSGKKLVYFSEIEMKQKKPTNKLKKQTSLFAKQRREHKMEKQ